MVKVKDNLTGKVFTRLTVLKQAEDYIEPKSGQHRAQWLCECSCEEHNQVIVLGKSLKQGKTKSCGCLRKENIRCEFQKTNNYNLTMDCGVGYCTNTGNEFYFDLEDYDKIKDYCWYENIRPNGYHALVAYNKDTGSNVRMHQIIIGSYYDHINRNPLDNRKSNLRKATDKENSTNRKIRIDNTSGVTGVSFDKRRGKWWAFVVGNDKKVVSLGYFINKDDAIRARLQGEIKYYGEFAPQQHLYEQYNVDMNI
jgi:hypothetical protein